MSQSLAGRAAVLHLLAPSLDELRRFERPPTSLLDTLWMGAYPRIHDRHLSAGSWLADYVTTYVQRDVRTVLDVTDLSAFGAFVRLVAGRTAQVLNLSSLGADAGLSHHTVKAWLSVLEASFLVTRLEPWHGNVNKRITKAPKLHFLDSGLICHLLGIREPSQLEAHPLRGAIFESWVAAEVAKARLHRGLVLDLRYFRDHKGLEVDLVLEGATKMVLVEVKSGSTIQQEMLRPTHTLADLLRARAAHQSVEERVLYGGEARQQRGSVDVLPWAQIDSVDWAF